MFGEESGGRKGEGCGVKEKRKKTVEEERIYKGQQTDRSGARMINPRLPGCHGNEVNRCEADSGSESQPLRNDSYENDGICSYIADAILR